MNLKFFSEWLPRGREFASSLGRQRGSGVGWYASSSQRSPVRTQTAIALLARRFGTPPAVISASIRPTTTAVSPLSRTSSTGCSIRWYA